METRWEEPGENRWWLTVTWTWGPLKSTLLLASFFLDFEEKQNNVLLLCVKHADEWIRWWLWDSEFIADAKLMSWCKIDELMTIFSDDLSVHPVRSHKNKNKTIWEIITSNDSDVVFLSSKNWNADIVCFTICLVYSSIEDLHYTIIIILQNKNTKQWICDWPMLFKLITLTLWKQKSLFWPWSSSSEVSTKSINLQT